jgi:hypothetical protein
MEQRPNMISRILRQAQDEANHSACVSALRQFWGGQHQPFVSFGAGNINSKAASDRLRMRQIILPASPPFVSFGAGNINSKAASDRLRMRQIILPASPPAVSFGAGHIISKAASS